MVSVSAIPQAFAMSSNDLSRAVGVDPEQFRRHQAMADVEWAMAIYDRIMEETR